MTMHMTTNHRPSSGSPTLALLCACVAIAAGCGPGLSAEEQEHLHNATFAIDSLIEMHVLAGHLFGLSGTLSPSKTEAENAQAAQAVISASLAGCGSAVANNGSLEVSFGASPGCTLGAAGVATGHWSLLFAVQAGTVGALVFCSGPPCQLNGADMLGMPAFSTADGSTFTMMGDLQSAQSSNSFSEATVTLTASSGALDGPFGMNEAARATQGAATGVTWTRGECAPHAGSVHVTGMPGNMDLTLTYSSDSPTTGQASVSTSRGTVAASLPRHGSCTYGG